MPPETQPSPERPRKPQNLERKDGAFEQAKRNLFQLKKNITSSWNGAEKKVTHMKKSFGSFVGNVKTEIGKELKLDAMSGTEFRDYLLWLEKEGKLKDIPTSKFIFKSELLEASQSIDPKDAQKLVHDAKEKYSKCLSDLLRMKVRGTLREEIYMHLLTQQGGYRRSSSYVSELLVNGFGNCEARAKLMIMLLQDLYGNTIDVQLQSINIQDSQTGKIEAHTRAVVKDINGYYILEFPQVRYRKPNESKDMDLYPTDTLKKGYLRAKGVLPTVPSKSFPVDPISTNTFLSLPSSDKVESDDGQKINAKDAIAIRAELAHNSPKSKKSKDDDLEIPRDVSNYAHMKILTDPDIAYDILNKVNGNSEELNLTGLVLLNEECAEILATGFKGTMLRIGISSSGIHLTQGLATLLSKFDKNLELALDSDLSPDIATILAKPSPHGAKPYLGLFINGKLPPESAKILMQSREGNMYGILFSVTEGISLETAKILNVPDRPVMLDDTGKMPFEVIKYFLHNMHPRANFTLRLTYVAPDVLMKEYWKVNCPGFCLEMPGAKVCGATSSGEKEIDTLYARRPMTRDLIRLIRPDSRQFAIHLFESITPEAVSKLCSMNRPFTLFSAKSIPLDNLQKAAGSRKLIESDHNMGEGNRYLPMRYRYDFE